MYRYSIFAYRFQPQQPPINMLECIATTGDLEVVPWHRPLHVKGHLLAMVYHVSGQTYLFVWDWAKEQYSADLDITSVAVSRLHLLVLDGPVLRFQQKS